MRPHFRWQLRSRSLELGERTLVMGVVNVTPDSFYDGGNFATSQDAVDHALSLLEQGADIVDVGGESTRPGSRIAGEAPTPKHTPVSAEQERKRVLPVIEGIVRANPDAVVSIDTYKAEVARAAVAAGAEIVNDVSAFQWDEEMGTTCAQLQCGVVLMHTRGTPGEWRQLPQEANIPTVVEHDLANRVQVAFERGVERSRIVLDPGFGFGKNFEENFPLLARLNQLQRLGFPILAGTSRKSFVGRAIGSRIGVDPPAPERLYGSLSAMVISILRGAHIVRVHDVPASVQAAAVADAVLGVDATNQE